MRVTISEINAAYNPMTELYIPATCQRIQFVDRTIAGRKPVISCARLSSAVKRSEFSKEMIDTKGCYNENKHGDDIAMANALMKACTFFSCKHDRAKEECGQGAEQMEKTYCIVDKVCHMGNW